MMAAFVSCTVAFVGSLTLYRARHGTFPSRIPRAGLPYMALTGAIVCGGMSFMYAALDAGEVVVVSPLIATYPVFTLLLAVPLGMEQVSRKLVLGVVLVVGGVIALGIARGG